MALALSAAQALPVRQSKRVLGSRAALQCRGPKHSRANRLTRLEVQANELNKWANRGGMDDEDAPPEIDRDTQAVILRVLTMRAAQKLLLQLQELDVFVARWLHNYLSEHPPKDGNKFVQALMKTPGTVVKDHTNNTSHTIDPANLAHRLLALRADLAYTSLRGFTEYVEIENTAVMRSHLEAFTYTAGGYEDNNGRRGYKRAPRRPSK